MRAVRALPRPGARRFGALPRRFGALRRPVAVAVALLLAGMLAVAGCGGGGGGNGKPTAGASWDDGTPSDVPTWTPPSDSDGEKGGDSGGGRWLLYGPGSPNTDTAPDPTSVYDLIQDGKCGTARKQIRVGSEAPPDQADAWTVLGGLAEACLALQGKDGSWTKAEQAYGAVRGYRPVPCKDRAAYRLLGQVVRYHRQHPHGRVRTSGPHGGTLACHGRIVLVDAGGDTVAHPGDTVTIGIAGAWFDQYELSGNTSGAIVYIGRVKMGIQHVAGCELSPDTGECVAQPYGGLVTARYILPDAYGPSRHTVSVSVRVGKGSIKKRAALTIEPTGTSPPTTEPPTDAPPTTEPPTEAPTEAPTDAPTDPAPTDTPAADTPEPR